MRVDRWLRWSSSWFGQVAEAEVAAPAMIWHVKNRKLVLPSKSQNRPGVTFRKLKAEMLKVTSSGMLFFIK